MFPGRITLGEGSSALRDALRELVAKGNKKILLNLSEVSYIDSSGIGELVSGFTTVANQGGTLKLLSLTKRVKDLLQITKLYTVFDVHEDEAHAVRSFAVEVTDASQLRTACAGLSRRRRTERFRFPRRPRGRSPDHNSRLTIARLSSIATRSGSRSSACTMSSKVVCGGEVRGARR